MTVWRVVCSETRWRSCPYENREAAERKASSIDAKIARVNGVSLHRHQVVEVDTRDPASAVAV